MNNVMLDLETWGVGNDALIISIGAIKFDIRKITNLNNKIEISIDPESSAKFGTKIDPGTILWWMNPTLDVPRRKWVESFKVSFDEALYGFKDWLVEDGEFIGQVKVWGNGAAFDNVILRNSFAKLGLQGWDHWNDRCYRTMKGLVTTAPKPTPDDVAAVIGEGGVAHGALYDATFQAIHLQSIMGHIVDASL